MRTRLARQFVPVEREMALLIIAFAVSISAASGHLARGEFSRSAHVHRVDYECAI